MANNEPQPRVLRPFFATTCLLAACGGSTSHSDAGLEGGSGDSSVPLEAAALDSSVDAEAPDASADSGPFSPCGPAGAAIDGGEVACAPGASCIIGCIGTALCITIDASTCPPGTLGDCSALDAGCLLGWFEGGTPNPGCCVEVLPVYWCSQQAPPVFGGPTSASECIDLDAGTFLCACAS